MHEVAVTMPLDPLSLSRHAEGLRRLARSLVGDAAAADDIVQDTFVAALHHGPADGVPVGAWLVRVVRNLSARWWRGRARLDRRLRRLTRPTAAPPPEEVLERARLHRHLMSVLTALDDPYRTTLLLRYFDDVPPRGIALRMGVPPATVRTWIHRGLAQLRERLDAEQGGRRSWAVAFLPLVGGPRRAAKVSLFGGLAVTSKTWMAGAMGLVLLLGAGVALLVTPHAEAPPRGTAPPSRLDENAPGLAAARPTDVAPAPSERAGAVDDAFALRGVVEDSTGKPIAGATVTAFRIPWGSERDDDGHPVEIGLGTTRSSADGAFALPVASGNVLQVRASAAGFATSVLEEARAGQRVTITLGVGVSLTVRAVDERGEGVAGARVRLWAPRTWQSPSPGVEAAGATDADGRCRFDGLPRGSWTMLSAVHGTLGAPPWRRVELPPTGPSEQTVLFRVGRTLSGRVTRLEGGDPIPGARVGLGWTLFRAVRTNADGEFVLSGYTGEGHFELFAEAPGFSSAREVVSAENRYDLRLAPGATIVGRVVTTAGQPIADARIRASGGEVTQRRYATSTADGRFELDGARRVAVQTLVVSATGFGRTHLDVSVLDVERFDVQDVVLPSGRAVEGVVLGPDGVPVSDVTVTLQGANRDRGRLLPSGAKAPNDAFVDRQTTRTDTQGTFRFADLPPATYEVEVSPRGRRGILRPIELGATADLRGVEFRLAGSRRLRVRVHDTAGRPLVGFMASVTCADGYFMNVTTDATGEAVFWSDIPFRWVEALPDTGSEGWIPPERRRLLQDESDVELVFGLATLAHGVVLGTDGRPVGMNQMLRVTRNGVSLTQQSAFSGNQTFTDGSGRFRVLVPVGASVEVEAHETVLPDGTVIGGRVEGVEGGANLELRLQPIAKDETLYVVALAPDGTPAPDVQIYVRVGARNVAGANARTGPDGRAGFAGLPRSGGTLFATPLAESPGHERWIPMAVSIRPHGGETTLRFREALVVRGKVVTPDGSPAVDAVVTVLRAGQPDAPVVVDAEGDFRLLLDPAEADDVRLAAAVVDARSPWVDLPADGSPVTLTLSKP